MAYGAAYAYLGDPHLAQDAAQDAFVEALESLTQLREPAACPGWSGQIVYRRCGRVARSGTRRTVPLERAACVPATRDDPVQHAEARETEAVVRSAIAALPEAQ